MWDTWKDDRKIRASSKTCPNPEPGAHRFHRGRNGIALHEFPVCRPQHSSSKDSGFNDFTAWGASLFSIAVAGTVLAGTSIRQNCLARRLACRLWQSHGSRTQREIRVAVVPVVVRIIETYRVVLKGTRKQEDVEVVSIGSHLHLKHSTSIKWESRTSFNPMPRLRSLPAGT